MLRKLRLGAAAVVILAVALCLPGQALAGSRLLVGQSDGEWFTGIHIETVSRRLMGFIGYQEDTVSGVVAVSQQPRLMGYFHAGRQVFVGNVKYAAAVYGGNPDFFSNLMGDNRLGVRAEYKQMLGKDAAGAKGEINLVGKPRLSLTPYLELHGDGYLTAQLEFGTEGIALGAIYDFAPASKLDASVFAVYDFAHAAVDCGASLTLADSLVLAGAWHTADGMRLDLTWRNHGYSLEAGIKWREGQVHWYAGWSLRI